MSNYNQLKNASVLNPTGNVDLGSPTNAYGNIYMVGNLAIGTTTVSGSTIISPRVNSIVYPGDDTAADTAGGQTITLNGAGFVTGASVLIGTTAASVVSVVSSTQISFTSPAMSSGSYVLYIVNPSGATGISIPGLQYSGTPAWSTPAGSLGTGYESAAISNTLTATGDAPIIYSLQSGTLPPGSTLNSGTGLLSGTASSVSSSTTYNFTIRATDAQNQDTDRAFSLTVSPDFVTWSAPANNSTTTTYEYTDISNVAMSATSAAGKSITYTANSLPTGITISGANITGTPTVVASTSTLLTGTAATTNKTATRTVNFVVNQDVVTWSSPADNTTTSAYVDQLMANVTMSASSAAGKSITYTANALPTGLSISGANITGTPTLAASSSSLITATASTTNRTATRTFNWVISVANDTYFKNVSLLLNGETTVTPFISDASTNSFGLTIAGDTKPVLFNPYTPGYYSNYFDGTGDYFTLADNTALQFGTGDFTVELWWYPTSLATDQAFLGSSSNGGYDFVWRTSTGLNIGRINTAFDNTFAWTPTLGQWYHIAYSRSGTSLKVFVNGSQVGSTATNSISYVPGSGGAVIGGSTTVDRLLIGYISNFRLVKGTAVYTSAFTPPTSPLTAIANTSLLTCQSNRFIDNSTNNFTITKFGDTTISPNIPFTQNSSYSTYGSGYFDGTGDYLRALYNTAFSFGTNNLTMECWLYNGSQTNASVIGQGQSNPNAGQSIGLFITTSGVIGFYVAASSGVYQVSITGNLSLNQWNHVAGTRSGSTWTLWINGVSAGTATWSGTVTQDATGSYGGMDIGHIASSYTYTGYISNARVVNGTAVYTTAFTPPTTPLTAIANTSLLTLQYNGGATNQAIIDNSNFNNIITRSGNTSQGTFSPYSVTGWSNYFDGSGDTIVSASTTAFNLSTNDFCIEMWFYWNGTYPSGNGYAGLCGSNTDYKVALCIWNGSGGSIPKIMYGLSSNGSAWNILQAESSVGSNTVLANQWNHIALCRTSTTISGFLNGARDITVTSSASVVSRTEGYVVGAWFSTLYYFPGYISNFRFTVGQSPYNAATTTITLPTTPLTSIAYTAYLTCQSNIFIDNSPNNFTITKNGDTSVQAFDPFGSVPEAIPLSYSISSVNGNNYVDVSSSSNIAFGSGDYTMEWYTYLTTDQSHQPYMWDFRSAGGAGTQYAYFGSATGLITNYGTFTIPSILNTWRHWAITRSGTTWRLFIDGTQISSSTDSSTYTSSGTYRFGLRYAAESSSLIGLVSNLRFVKGQALYTGSFTPSTTPLTTTTVGSTGAGAAGSLTGTVVVLTLNSTTIVDSSAIPATITSSSVKPNRNNPFGYTAQSATSYTPSLHGGSAYFDGTGDYITAPANTSFDVTSSNFTIEGWVYLNGSQTGKTPVAIGDASSSRSIFFWVGGSGQFEGYFSNDGANWQAYYTGGNTVPVNAWVHFAFVRNSTTLSIYINGVSAGGSQTGTPTTASTGKSLTIGSGINGYLSDIRITKGVAIYTGTFTPPTQTLGNYSTTYPASLLLNMNNGGIIDYHSTNVIETVGNAQLSTAVKKYNVASMYFDGTGDYINIPYSQLFNFGTGDFTVECWANITYVQYSAIISSCNSTMTSSMWLLGFSNTAHIMTFNFDGSGAAICGADYTSYEGTWTHIAACRSGTTLKLFFNGTQVQSVTNSTSFTGDTANPVTIGRRYNNQTQYYMNGYIDDLRITKGYARYTANFTAPTSAFPTK